MVHHSSTFHALSPPTTLDSVRNQNSMVLVRTGSDLDWGLYEQQQQQQLQLQLQLQEEARSTSTTNTDHHTNHSCNCSVLYCRRMRPAQRRTKPDLMLPSRRRSLGAGGTVGVRKGGGRHTAATTATEAHGTQPAPAATAAVLRRAASLRF